MKILDLVLTHSANPKKYKMRLNWYSPDLELWRDKNHVLRFPVASQESSSQGTAWASCLWFLSTSPCVFAILWQSEFPRNSAMTLSMCLYSFNLLKMFMFSGIGNMEIKTRFLGVGVGDWIVHYLGSFQWPMLNALRVWGHIYSLLFPGLSSHVIRKGCSTPSSVTHTCCLTNCWPKKNSGKAWRWKHHWSAEVTHPP